MEELRVIRLFFLHEQSFPPPLIPLRRVGVWCFAQIKGAFVVFGKAYLSLRRTELWLRCCLTFCRVTIPQKMYDDAPGLLASRHMSNCASYSLQNVLRLRKTKQL